MAAGNVAQKVTPTYIQQFDQVPAFWQFLGGLRADDIIAELIQNDLDAGSTYTEISFLEDRLICKGNGEPIDEDGWVRLSFLSGAGEEAPRKHNRIGVKNHGLKACFVIGDNIALRSDGKLTCQTLYKDGHDDLPSPGAYSEPILDPQAPSQGCAVEVDYRFQALNPPTGEGLEFAPMTPERLSAIFDRACGTAARRFIAVVAPKQRQTFKLVISHYQHGRCSFVFSCGRVSKVSRHRVYRRKCLVSGRLNGRELPDNYYETATSLKFLTSCLVAVKYQTSSGALADFGAN